MISESELICGPLLDPFLDPFGEENIYKDSAESNHGFGALNSNSVLCHTGKIGSSNF